MSYTGRFAPSPTGPLHFGSLLAALASYLDAKHQQGRWFVRIENLDPPREQAGASDSILRTLEAYGLHWDGSVIYQSDRQALYTSLLKHLHDSGHSYPCGCSRSTLKQRQALKRYDRHCILTPPDKSKPHAIRARFDTSQPSFIDAVQGQVLCPQEHTGDFIIYRRDQLFAYQLAVVADDHAQGISHVVRGADLLYETFAQHELQKHLNYEQPNYAHIPIAVSASGQKLSKQNLAPAIDELPVIPTLLKALSVLGQARPPQSCQQSTETLLHWASQHWQIDHIPNTTAITTGY